MIKARVHDRHIVLSTLRPVTSGSVGLPVDFEFDDAWEGLSKIAVFKGSGTAVDVALLTDSCVVPHEVLVDHSGLLWIGVYGANGAGTIVMPTIWGKVGYIYEGTEPSEVDPDDPTPSWVAQVQAAAAEALETANAVAAAAAAGDFDGADGVSPTVTVTEITGGHRVTITDVDHPDGQSFDVMDGSGSGDAGTLWCTYGTTTASEIEAAWQAGKRILVIHNNMVYAMTYRYSSSNFRFVAPYGDCMYQTYCNNSVWADNSVQLALHSEIPIPCASDPEPIGEAVPGEEVTYSPGDHVHDFPSDFKTALLQLAQKVAYIDANGPTYYNDLYNALYHRVLSYITATFTQGTATIYDTDSLDVLKQYLVVTANYSDSSTATVTGYTLSGTLTAGTSMITVTYEGKTTTFTVTVTHVAGTCTVTNALIGCSSSNAATSVTENSSYSATITASAGYTLTGATVSITMGGTDITSSAYNAGTISIASVTGNLVITVSAVALTSYSITNTLSNCSSSNAAVSVYEGSSYSATITAASGYTLTGATVSVTMGSTDITSTAYNNGTISIASVTGNLVISVTAVAASVTYTVTNSLTNCSNSNSASTVAENATYLATITAATGYTLTGATVSITMGGTDITSTAYSNGTISIANVTGNISISVSAVQVVVASISASYTQSGTVYDTDTLDSLKDDLVVTATYSDSSTAVVPSTDYTLSGTLVADTTSTITVSYEGETDTFNVTVSSSTSYISNGLIAHWDAIDNQGTGTHDPTATTWIDLINGYTWEAKTTDSTKDWAWDNGDSLVFTPTITGNQSNPKNVFLCTRPGTMVRTLEVVLTPTSFGSAGEFTSYLTGVTDNTVQIVGVSASDNTFIVSGSQAGYNAVNIANIKSITGTYSETFVNTGAYMNGISVTSRGSNHSYKYHQNASMVLGSQNAPNGFYYAFSGTIHAIRFYDRELTAAEIAHNYSIDSVRFGLS